MVTATPGTESTRSRFAHVLLACLLVFATGCVVPGTPRDETVEPIRISDQLGLGDPARRASMRLVVEGLDSDVIGRRDRAQGSYERALQVDPTNAFAYLALARHHLDGSTGEGATDLLDQASALFESEGLLEPEVDVHLIGLRGRAMHAEGRGEAAVLYLEQARELAPDVWRDGYLSAEELR
jgi:tetratricopeptide (TPR) repeat protein